MSFFCVGGIKPPWGGFFTPKGVVLTRGVVLSPIRGGYIPPKGWYNPPKGVVLSPIKVGIKPPGVVLRVVLSPISGWFYARDQPSTATPSDPITCNNKNPTIMNSLAALVSHSNTGY